MIMLVAYDEYDKTLLSLLKLASLYFLLFFIVIIISIALYYKITENCILKIFLGFHVTIVMSR